MIVTSVRPLDERRDAPCVGFGSYVSGWMAGLSGNYVIGEKPPDLDLRRTSSVQRGRLTEVNRERKKSKSHFEDACARVCSGDSDFGSFGFDQITAVL